jgi:signal transduction histidine kinase
LLSNAIKFTEKGTVTLAVTARPEPAASGQRWRWSFTVRDTGMGIAPEHQAGLFQAYGQVDAGISRRFGGTGLGLAISRQLAKLLDGDLRLGESKVGQGSTFVLEIVTGETLPVDVSVIPRTDRTN